MHGRKCCVPSCKKTRPGYSNKILRQPERSTHDWLTAHEIDFIRHEDSSSPGLNPLFYFIILEGKQADGFPDGTDNVTLHSFPNPNKNRAMFYLWVKAVGGQVATLDPEFVYKYRRVCTDHFESRFISCSNRVCPDAVPNVEIQDDQKDNEDAVEHVEMNKDDNQMNSKSKTKDKSSKNHLLKVNRRSRKSRVVQNAEIVIPRLRRRIGNVKRTGK